MEKKFAILKVEMKVTPNLINFEKWFIHARLGTEMVKCTNQMDYFRAPNLI